MIRDYPAAVLVSITTGILLVPFGEVHEAIEHVAGRSVWTHEMASEALMAMLRERVLAQHPKLVDADAIVAKWKTHFADTIPWDVVRNFGGVLNAQFGWSLPVEKGGDPPPMDNSALAGKPVLVVRT